MSWEATYPKNLQAQKHYFTMVWYFPMKSRGKTPYIVVYIAGLVYERCHSSVLAIDL